jgi:predicted TIM-barrel fold metal-dependent hydrolase
MIIDAHAHVGDFRWSKNDPRQPMTWEKLIARLDDEGIDKAIFLPVYNASPELTPWGFFHSERQWVREQVIDAAKYADRIIPFGNMDPRWGGNSATTDFGEIGSRSTAARALAKSVPTSPTTTRARSTCSSSLAPGTCL